MLAISSQNITAKVECQTELTQNDSVLRIK